MRWVGTIVFVFSLAASLGLFTWAWTAYRDGRRSLGWPSVPGRVTSSMVRRETTETESRLEWTYYPAVSYDYRVNGQAFNGTRIGVGGVVGTSRSEDAEAVANRYAVGSNVDVYYDPAEPEYAVLVRGANVFGVWVTAAGGAGSLIFGILFAVTWDS
jgi:hypothetical protein